MKVMNARKYEGQPLGSFSITPKIDGHRLIVTVDNKGNVELKTRNGNAVEVLGIDFKGLPWGYVYDGELQAWDGKFETTSKLLKTTKTDLYYHLFDAIPFEVAKRGTYGVPYCQRYQDLQQLHMPTGIKLVPCLYSGTDTNMIEHHLQNRGRKCDGVMINLNNGLYTSGLSDYIFKVKPEYTYDLKIIDFIVGYDGDAFSSLVVDYKGKEVACRVQSKHVGANLWERRHELLGKIVEVKHSGETKGKSLRHAMFVRMREDKTNVSYN